MSNDGNTKFWIDEFSGDIVLINPLDFESFQNYIVTYVAADHGNLKVNILSIILNFKLIIEKGIYVIFLKMKFLM